MGADDPRPSRRVTPPSDAWDDEPVSRRRNDTLIRVVGWLVVLAFALPLVVGALLALMT